MMKKSFIFLVFVIFVQTVFAQWPLTDVQKREISELAKETNAPPQMREADMMIIYVNGGSGQLAYRAAAMNKLLEEANSFADKLQLPTKRPIEISDIQYPIIFPPWENIVRKWDHNDLPDTVFSNRIYDTSIPREERLRALKFGADGVLETTNFFFSFRHEKLGEVMRLDGHENERYSRRLEELIGKPSLIDTNGAYQLATQWLAAVDIDMAALNKLKWTVNQLHYKTLGATNYVTLPLFYVDFGNKHYPASGNLHAFDEPLVSVEVLGTTKELQDLEIKDLSFSRRPLLLITNALDLIRTPKLLEKRLQTPIKSHNLNPSQ